MPRAAQETIFGIGDVACNLGHPSIVGMRCDAGDVDRLGGDVAGLSQELVRCRVLGGCWQWCRDQPDGPDWPKTFCETHHFSRHTRPIVLSPVENKKKQWRARVVLPVRTTSEDGQLVNILPGEYTLGEEQGARYQLIRCTENSTHLSLWFADLLLCTYMGQLEILGIWP